MEEIRNLNLRLRDMCRYQHLVLATIHFLTNPERLVPCDDIRAIKLKAEAALSAASKSGLLT